MDMALSVLDATPAASEDPLPEAVRAEHGLMGWTAAVRALHAPADVAQYDSACRRLAFQVRRLL